MATDSLDDLRLKIAQSCRILASLGILKGIHGHVSHRIADTEEMLIRCRGDVEYGVNYTTSDQIRRLAFDGTGDDLGDIYEAPRELPIHGEILRVRPEVNCVIHGHPPATLLCGIAGIELRPIFGSYDPQALSIAVEGVPIYPRSVLISRPELANGVIAAMGPRDVCLMKGHGITVTGTSVEDATIRAIKIESLAKVHWELAKASKTAPDIGWEDVEEFARRPRGMGMPRATEWLWKFYLKALEEEGRIPDDLDLDMRHV